MPIEIKELVVRAFVDSQTGMPKHVSSKIAKAGKETSDFNTEMLEQLKRKLTDKKDR
jgi:hypothetical protein